jgi:hypothetical protein
METQPPAFTFAELAALLEVPVSVIETLVAEGRMLCYLRNGTARVPMAQVETFLREGLIRLYRAEASPRTIAPASVRIDPPHRQTQTEVEHVDPRPSPEEKAVLALGEGTFSEHESSARPDGGGSARPGSRGSAPPAVRISDIETVPQPGDAPEDMRAEGLGAEDVRAEDDADPAEVPAASEERLRAYPYAAPARETREQRIAQRYVPLRQITGIFGDKKITVLQLSATGLRIRHPEALVPGEEAKLSFALMRPARSIVIRAKVVWTSLARAGEERFSISGLRVLEHGERLAQAIESLVATHALQPERRSHQRRETDAAGAPAGITDDEIALVTGAMRRFADDPVEATRWYSRARFAMADEDVRRIAPSRPRDRDEVLGIWEYLERQIDLTKVADVVSWARGA